MTFSNLKTIFMILTDKCIKECEHCAINASPHKKNVISINELRIYLRKLRNFKSLEYIIFTGGEPFLFYSLLRIAINDAHNLGYKTAVYTSGYWIQSSSDFSYYLEPLIEVGLNTLIISSDIFHNNIQLLTMESKLYDFLEEKHVKLIFSSFKSKNYDAPPIKALNGAVAFDGDIFYRGRASKNLSKNQTLWNPKDLNICPHINFFSPAYLHLDFNGNLSHCPGISIHNASKSSTLDFVNHYDPLKHPILKHLIDNGPFALAKHHNLDEILNRGYADQCHFCYETRKTLIKSYPYILTPKSFYIF